MKFDGKTFVAPLDEARLTRQHSRVFLYMRDGQWRTLKEIADAVQGSESGVSARLRDLRKTRFGGYMVDRRRNGRADRGKFECRVDTSVRQTSLFPALEPQLPLFPEAKGGETAPSPPPP